MRLALEDAIGANLDPESNVWHWLIEHSADTFNRYKVGHDGLLPYKDIKGRESTVPISPPGEKALYHVTKREATTRPKSEPLWNKGVYFATLWMSNEYVIWTRDGVTRAHSINGLFDVEPWDEELPDEMKRAPWRPHPYRLEHKIPTNSIEGGGGGHRR